MNMNDDDVKQASASLAIPLQIVVDSKHPEILSCTVTGPTEVELEVHDPFKVQIVNERKLCGNEGPVRWTILSQDRRSYTRDETIYPGQDSIYAMADETEEEELTLYWDPCEGDEWPINAQHPEHPAIDTARVTINLTKSRNT